MKRLKIGLKKRKLKIFLIFLLVSSLSWFISELSGEYTGRAVFDVVYQNVPDSLLFVGGSPQQIDVKLKASGFTFLAFNFKNKKISIDVSKALEKNGVYTVPKSTYQLDIEQQLPKSIDLIRIYNDQDIALELYLLSEKKIPVISQLEIDLNQNFMLDGVIQINPDSIVIRGPKKELDQLNAVKTSAQKIENIAKDFTISLTLETHQIPNVVFSESQVSVLGKVARFSERLLEIPITVRNLPETHEIRIFPDKISLLCKAKMNDLKQLMPTDFEVVMDYEAIKNTSKPTVALALEKYPEVLVEPKLMEKEVRFILKRKE